MDVRVLELIFVLVTELVDMLRHETGGGKSLRSIRSKSEEFMKYCLRRHLFNYRIYSVENGRQEMALTSCATGQIQDPAASLGSPSVHGIPSVRPCCPAVLKNQDRIIFVQIGLEQVEGDRIVFQQTRNIVKFFVPSENFTAKNNIHRP